jgi:cell division septation protein DedD
MPPHAEELSRDVDDLLREQDEPFEAAAGVQAGAAPGPTVAAEDELPAQEPFPPFEDDDPLLDEAEDSLPPVSISQSAQQLAAAELGDTAESDHDDAFIEESAAPVVAAGAAALGASRAAQAASANPEGAERTAGATPDEPDAPAAAASAPPPQAEDEDERPARWPLVLIGVAVVALLLLGIGGYGVLQERSAQQNQIRELQARLATAVSQEEARANRQELTTAVQQARTLERDLARLQTENARLSERLEELERDAAAQAERVAAAGEAQREAEQAARASAAAAASRNSAENTAGNTAGGGGEWFVNFGSYAQRSVAERWQSRLQPESGRLLIQEAQSNGRALYRLRIVGLADRDSAERVARALERAHQVEKLWVGRESN